MRLRGIHIVCMLVVLSAFGACRGPKRISKSEMKDIYVEMFLLDQRLKDDRPLKRHADTMLVYEGLLEAYGYTTDDYLYSVAYYLKDPERYAKLLKQVSDQLEQESKRVEREIKAEQRRSQFLHVKGFPLDSMLLPFHRDSAWAGAVRFERDTILKDFWRLVPLRPDTLQRDSLILDSLRNEADSSQLRIPLDSVRTDTLRIH